MLTKNTLHIIQKRPLILRSQYGDESIALVQWAFEAGLSGTVVSIDTGWAAAGWQDRVLKGEAHAKRCGFKIERLISPITFSEAVQGRKSFPSAELQWCTGLLKGLPFLDWLEPIDLSGEAIILIAKRKAAAMANATLAEWIEPCQYHGDRTVWHPLIEVEDLERDALLERAGFIPLGHRALECDPCINSSAADLKRLARADQQKYKRLEAEIGHVWSLEPPEVKHPLDLFYRGCGNHFGCGL